MIKLLHGDVLESLKKLKSESVHCCITSPPYFALRDYQTDGQVGHEKSVQLYVDKMVEISAELKRVLRKDGTYWLNIGDTFSRSSRNAGRTDASGFSTAAKWYTTKKLRIDSDLPSKNLYGVPWRTALALQDDGWILRCDIIWAKDSAIPEPVKDRPSRNHEYIFMLAKSPNYYYDRESDPSLDRFKSLIKTGDKIQRSVWKTTHSTGAMKACNNCLKTYTLEEHKRLANSGSSKSMFVSKPNLDVKNKVCSSCGSSDWLGHVAPYPQTLVSPCIASGTSGKGCCAECGVCWVRGGKSWKKNCDCKTDEVKPCVVLDIFNGSGTTGVVAIRMGRDYIGIDLNKRYLELARKRMERVASMRGIEL